MGELQPTLLAESLELHSFPHLDRGEQSLGVYCSRAALPESDLLLNTSQTLISASEGAFRKQYRSPACFANEERLGEASDFSKCGGHC